MSTELEEIARRAAKNGFLRFPVNRPHPFWKEVPDTITISRTELTEIILSACKDAAQQSEDTKRLDWLDENIEDGARDVRIFEEDGGVILEVPKNEGPQLGGIGTNLREAIDAAREDSAK